MLLLLGPAALAAEMMLAPGGTATTSFDKSDRVAWLDYGTDCAAQVLDLPEEAEAPVQIEAIRLAFSSGGGVYDHRSAVVAVGLERIDAGAEPTFLPGITTWAWPETWFSLSISSQYLTQVPLTNLLPPTWPLEMDDGRLVVWVCPADPGETGEWPRDEETGAASGLVIDGDLPGEDSYLFVFPELRRLSDLGIEGAWVIQAVASDARIESEALLSLATITPGEAPLGEVVEVELGGTAFGEGIGAFIGGLAVAGLTLIDETVLSGRSPSGLPVGLHDVTVVAEDGEEALLTSAFEVVGPDAEGGADSGGESGGGGDGGGGDGGEDSGRPGADDETAAPGGRCGCQGGPAGGGLLLALAALARRTHAGRRLSAGPRPAPGGSSPRRASG